MTKGAGVGKERQPWQIIDGKVDGNQHSKGKGKEGKKRSTCLEACVDTLNLNKWTPKGLAEIDHKRRRGNFVNVENDDRDRRRKKSRTSLKVERKGLSPGSVRAIKHKLVIEPFRQKS